MVRVRIPLLLLGVAGVIVCAPGFAETPAKPEVKNEKAGVAAYIGGQAVTIEELDAKILKTNMKLAQSLYDARREALDDVIVDRALASDAAARKITTDVLLKERLAEKTKPVTDEEIAAYYESNKGRMSGKPLEQMSAQIKGFLASQREGGARNALIAELKAKAEVRVTLEVPRIEVAVAANDPVKGPANAKVTIVEFSEFQ